MKQRFLIGLVVIFGLLGARAAFSGPVTDLEASNDDGFIELSWTEPTDVDDTDAAGDITYTYVVERSRSVDFSSPDTFGPLLEGSDEYADGNTVNNETWYYRVGASTDTGTTYSY
ncbi:hypothetical protein KKG61_04630, partial [bacterium]|nr:hypothetical protein [bacterium]